MDLVLRKERLLPEGLWRSLDPDFRAEIAAAVMLHGRPRFRDDLWEEAAKVLKSRAKTLKTKDTFRVAKELARRGKLITFFPGLLSIWISPYLARILETLEVVAPLDSDPETEEEFEEESDEEDEDALHEDGVVVIQDLSETLPILFSKHEPAAVLLFVLCSRLVSEAQREIIDGELESLTEEGLLEMIAEGARRSEEERSPAFQLRRSFEGLRRKVTSLEEGAEELAEVFEMASEELRDAGRLSDSSLPDDIAAHETHFQEVSRELLDLAKHHGHQEALEEPDSLKGMKDLLTKVQDLATKASERDRTAGTRDTLHKVLTIRHSTLTEFPPLDQAIETAERLLTEIDGDPAGFSPEVSDLLLGRHPLCLLLKAASEELDEEKEFEVDEGLRQAFSPKLAVAATAGRLTLGSADTEAEAEEPVPPDEAQPELPTETEPHEAVADTGLSEGTPTSLAETEPAAGEEEEAARGETEADAAATTAVEMDRDKTEVQSAQAPQDRSTEAHLPRLADTSAPQVWEHLQARNYRLALSFAKYSETPALVGDAIEALLLGCSIDSPSGERALLLKELFSRIDVQLGDVDQQRDRGIALLIAGAALRPALVAPMTGGGAILRRLSLGGPLYQLSTSIVEVGDLVNGITEDNLRLVRDEQGWDTRFRAVLNALARNVKDGPRRKLSYARATDVLRTWFQPNGLLRDLMDIARNDERERVDEVEKRLNALSIPDEVRQTAKKLAKVKYRPIEAKALNQLFNHAEEALEPVRAWVELLKYRPGQGGFHVSRIRELYAAFAQMVPRIRDDLRAETVSETPDLAAGATALLDALDAFEGLFEPDRSRVDWEELWRTKELPILLSGVAMSKAGSPVGNPEEVFNALEIHATEPIPGGEALRRRIEAKDFPSARRLLDLLAQSSEAPEQLAELKDFFWERMEAELDVLEVEVGDTRRTLEEYVINGAVPESIREDLDAKLVTAERLISSLSERARRREPIPPEDCAIKELTDPLEELATSLEEERAHRVRDLGGRLERLSLSAPQHSRILGVLKQGDLLTAEEYLSQAESGSLRPEDPKTRDAFLDFFPETARRYGEFLEKTAPTTFVKRVEEGHRIGERPDPGVRGAQAKGASQMVSAWYHVKKHGRWVEPSLRTLLEQLGFSVRSTIGGETRGETYVELEADPIRDRSRIPAAFFGSNAGGRYRLLGIWDRATEEDILNRVGDTSHGSPTLVFYFGRLSESARRAVGRLCCERKRTFVLLDEVLLAFLAGERGARLPVLLHCALPFTRLEPYVTTGSSVPPEMFFGRGRERQQILDRFGPSFLYGGRQLGKTALLRHVAAQHNDPEGGFLVNWIDLKGEGIGAGYGPEEVWSLLGTRVSSAGIFPGRRPSSWKAQRLAQEVERWLDEDPERRILFLLDEADGFLSQDASQDYAQTTALKNLVDKTEGRFRIVFAGLHNVLRTAEQSNHPLGHFGDPIGIGPLLAEGEVREAKALVTEPLGMLGYRFESPELVSRILAQTNYYPSLIQLYCSHLLRRLAEQREAEGALHDGPPFVITASHLDEAYGSRELKEGILRRFSLTLELDPRYELIAYLMAWLVDGGDMQIHEGLTREDLWNNSRQLWPEGFVDSNLNQFRALLDEMVGLGVLRHVAGDRYTFRNANVLLLMGGHDTIQKVFDKDRQPPPENHAATFRRPLKTDRSRLAPLTLQQMAELKRARYGVSIVVGSPLLGCGEVRTALPEAFADGHLHEAKGVNSSQDLNRWLSSLKTEEGGTTVAVVGETLPWSEAWLQTAVGKVRDFRSKRARLQVVFLADPRTALSLAEGGAEVLATESVSVVSLAPWADAALHYWLEANAIPCQPHDRERIKALTGNRPLAIYEFLNRVRMMDSGAPAALDRMEEEHLGGDQCHRWLTDSGLGDKGSLPFDILRTLSDFGSELSVTELVELGGYPDTERVRRVLRWAEWMALAETIAPETWVVDPWVREHLQHGC